jgi:hypothetical protein
VGEGSGGGRGGSRTAGLPCDGGAAVTPAIRANVIRRIDHNNVNRSLDENSGTDKVRSQPRQNGQNEHGMDVSRVMQPPNECRYSSRSIQTKPALFDLLTASIDRLSDSLNAAVSRAPMHLFLGPHASACDVAFGKLRAQLARP